MKNETEALLEVPLYINGQRCNGDGLIDANNVQHPLGEEKVAQVA